MLKKGSLGLEIKVSSCQKVSQEKIFSVLLRFLGNGKSLFFCIKG